MMGATDDRDWDHKLVIGASSHNSIQGVGTPLRKSSIRRYSLRTALTDRGSSN